MEELDFDLNLLGGLLDYSPWVLVVLLILQKIIPQTNTILREERERADVRYSDTLRVWESRERTFIEVLQKLSEAQAVQVEILKKLSSYIEELNRKQDNNSLLLSQLLGQRVDDCR